MRLGLRMGLNSRQGGGSVLDPDARLYITEVEAALGTPIATALPSATSNPKRIISDFIKAEKAASRWSLHKRIYLPIYNNAAASAIDMVSRLSGTFTGLGSVNHAAGYVQGDGASGYFNVNTTASNCGISIGSAFLGALIYQADSRTDFRAICGATNGTTQVARITHNGNNNLQVRMLSSAASADSAQTVANCIGIITASRTATNNLNLRQRVFSGVLSLDTDTNIDAGIVPTGNMAYMAQIESGSPNSYHNGRFGCFFSGNGLNSNSVDEFTANLKTLWESLTGLTLL